jgi:glycine hydroxymethyltransferase
MEKVCDAAHLTLNKNAVVGDAAAMNPGGVRIGAPAMTSRGLVEADFEQIARFLLEALEIAKEVQTKAGSKLLKDFVVALEGDAKAADLRARVEAFSEKFPMPGFHVGAAL